MVGRRVLIDDPYAGAKALLLAEVASANHCQAVWGDAFGFSTVFGLPSHLDAVELLHASLLTQATAAMVASGRAPYARDRRTPSFRRSFLVAFATRIGERLRAATERVTDEARAAHGDALLPVLAAQDDAVEAAMNDAFGDLGPMKVSSMNRDGWLAGRAAADLAHLGPDGELRAG